MMPRCMCTTKRPSMKIKELMNEIQIRQNQIGKALNDKPAADRVCELEIWRGWLKLIFSELSKHDGEAEYDKHVGVGVSGTAARGLVDAVLIGKPAAVASAVRLATEAHTVLGHLSPFDEAEAFAALHLTLVAAHASVPVADHHGQPHEAQHEKAQHEKAQHEKAQHEQTQHAQTVHFVEAAGSHWYPAELPTNLGHSAHAQVIPHPAQVEVPDPSSHQSPGGSHHQAPKK
jgi:hypothetical protein